MSFVNTLAVAFAFLGLASAKFITLEEELQMEIEKAEAEARREVCRTIVFVAALVSALLGLVRVVKDFLATQIQDEKAKGAEGFNSGALSSFTRTTHNSPMHAL
mmetsp:Transcript_29423/g.68516  ORF Transcript_29423/g.68516 Transcript_29423/m.68516 type:complete len:104 (-) Transcript_29423:59-370(-)|eukprot:CAMPEP_0178430856 /NCGR_PEP_ID=MMETSP0689_2-20121128/31537_1 /TAXON_ID=160604 /ORGANISM="Amphidinium massartii, Strain CS-259" /LENGTH=103 /DNA_ID=CAMNT_0020052729 /DNA_START=98 /DNA_END=409 /DNA_ORIENTATION=+